MHDYEPPRARFRRRVAEELELMVRRARAVERDCFWVLALDRPDGEEAGVRQARRTRARSRPRVLHAAQGGGEGGCSASAHEAADDQDSPRGGGSRRSRYVQCLLPADTPYFLLDLPRCTLDAAEAEVLLRERTGFVRAADRQAIGYSQKTCSKHAPIVRQYVVGDWDEAADDIRYVLFDLYGLPVTTPLYQTAAAFEGCPCWYERHVAFDTLTYPRPLGVAGCPRCRGGRKSG